MTTTSSCPNPPYVDDDQRLWLLVARENQKSLRSLFGLVWLFVAAVVFGLEAAVTKDSGDTQVLLNLLLAAAVATAVAATMTVVRLHRLVHAQRVAIHKELDAVMSPPVVEQDADDLLAD